MGLRVDGKQLIIWIPMTAIIIHLVVSLLMSFIS